MELDKETKLILQALGKCSSTSFIVHLPIYSSFHYKEEMGDRDRAAGARAPDEVGGHDPLGCSRGEAEAEVRKGDSGAKAACVDDLMELAGNGGRWDVTVLVLACCCECVARETNFIALYRSCHVSEAFPASPVSRYGSPETIRSSRRGLSSRHLHVPVADTQLRDPRSHARALVQGATAARRQLDPAPGPESGHSAQVSLVSEVLNKRMEKCMEK